MAQYSSSVLCKVLAVSWQYSGRHKLWSWTVPYRRCQKLSLPDTWEGCSLFGIRYKCTASITPVHVFRKVPPLHSRPWEGTWGPCMQLFGNNCRYSRLPILSYSKVQQNCIYFFFTVVLILLYNVSYWICLCSNKICSTII